MAVQIDNVTITPNPVNVSTAYIISVGVSETPNYLDDATFSRLELLTFSILDTEYKYKG